MENLRSNELKHFMLTNGIPEDAYDIPCLYRYFRTNPKKSIPDNDILTTFPSATQVLWMPGFWKVPSTTKLSNTKLYTEGFIYGMDVSSGVVVAALDPKPGDNILDLCCAPGAKLCMISDIMNNTGTLTGVDNAKPRISSCKALCLKYQITNVRLFLEDARLFNFLAPDMERPNSSKEIQEEEPGKIFSANPVEMFVISLDF